LFPERLRNAVAMARGKLDKLDLTDTEFYGAGEPSNYGEISLSDHLVMKRELILELSAESGATAIELRLANRVHPFSCIGVLQLLAGAPNVRSLKVDLQLTLNELGYFLCMNQESFRRMTVRELVLSEDFEVRKGDGGMRALLEASQKNLKESYTCLRCKCLVLKKINFWHPFWSDIDMSELFCVLMRGIRLIRVKVLRFDLNENQELFAPQFQFPHMWLPAPGTEPNAPTNAATALYTAVSSPWLRALIIRIGSDQDLHSGVKNTIGLALSHLRAPFSRLARFVYDGTNKHTHDEVELLRVLLTQQTLVEVVFSLDRLFENQILVHALLDLINANKPNLKVLRLRWNLRHFAELALIYSALLKNTELTHYCLPLLSPEGTQSHAAVLCECERCLSARVKTVDLRYDQRLSNFEDIYVRK
jgi:hypothetical protein